MDGVRLSALWHNINMGGPYDYTENFQSLCVAAGGRRAGIVGSQSAQRLRGRTATPAAAPAACLCAATTSPTAPGLCTASGLRAAPRVCGAGRRWGGTDE